MYLFVLPGFLFFVVFRHVRLLGNVVAFENYSPYLGFFDALTLTLNQNMTLFESGKTGFFTQGGWGFFRNPAGHHDGPHQADRPDRGSIAVDSAGL